MEKGVDRLVSELHKKSKVVAMLAPSFVAQFDYRSFPYREDPAGQYSRRVGMIEVY